MALPFGKVACELNIIILDVLIKNSILNNYILNMFKLRLNKHRIFIFSTLVVILAIIFRL